jgi:hypothetical protein
LRDNWRDRFINFCVIITGARLFGHGRLVELLMSIVAGFYAIELLIARNATSRIQVTEDVFWGGYGHYMLAAMWLLFAFTSLGLLFNIKAWPGSQVLRAFGAFMGFFIWGWMGIKLGWLGVWPSPGHDFACVFGIIGELLVIFKAAANLPRPGAPGNMGLE